MLMVGRCFWGVACGLADQAATIYSSEMAPPHVSSPHRHRVRLWGGGGGERYMCVCGVKRGGKDNWGWGVLIPPCYLRTLTFI